MVDGVVLGFEGGGERLQARPQGLYVEGGSCGVDNGEFRFTAYGASRRQPRRKGASEDLGQVLKARLGRLRHSVAR